MRVSCMRYGFDVVSTIALFHTFGTMMLLKLEPLDMSHLDIHGWDGADMRVFLWHEIFMKMKGSWHESFMG